MSTGMMSTSNNGITAATEVHRDADNRFTAHAHFLHITHPRTDRPPPLDRQGEGGFP
jgi:hypothetical protein